MSTVPEAMSTRNKGRYYGNGRDWETPPELFADLDSEFHFTLDPCATAETAKCSRYFTETEDGLAQDWGTERVFMNPPYGKEIYAWTHKAKTAAAAGALVVGLLPASTDLAWWHEDILEAGAEVRYLRGRVKFRKGDAWVNAFSASVIVIWRSQVTETETASDSSETVPALPGFAPGAPVAAETMTVTDQLVNALIPVGAFRTDDHRYYMNGSGPVPSVTTVLSILDKPAVVTWKAKETARALIRSVDEWTGSEEELINWALKEADKARDTAASLGSSVHLLADLIGNAPQGQEKPVEGFEISKEQYPYVQAYRHFLDRYSASSIVSSEKMVWSLNGYAGTYDLLMMLPTGGALLTRDMNEPLDPELWLIDIKTSKGGTYPEYGLQLAAYRYADSIILPGDPRLYPMPLIQRTGILHLRPDLYPDTGWRLIEYPTTDRDWIAFLGALEVYNWKQEKRFLKSKLSISKP